MIKKVLGWIYLTVFFAFLLILAICILPFVVVAAIVWLLCQVFKALGELTEAFACHVDDCINKALNR